MLRKLLMFGGFAMAMAFMGGTAKANTITYTQTFTFGTGTAYLNVSSGTATLTFGSDLNSYYTDQVAIQIPGATLVTTGSSVYTGTTDISSYWTIQKGKNSVNCEGTGNWFCAKDSTSSVSFNGLSFTWNFTGGDLTSPISVQFAVCKSAASGCAPSDPGDFLGNFSQSTPEPGTLYLLGAGLLPLLFFGRRFLG